MRTELLEVVARVITAHCYWIRVADITQHHAYAFVRDGHLMMTTCRHLTLEVTRPAGGTTRHRWHVSEADLDQVLSTMLKDDPGLHRRCHDGTLTKEDVEVLVHRASYGIIRLDIVDDDYTPPVFSSHARNNRTNPSTNLPQ